jgi:phenylacetate-CoA ligase
MVIVRGVNVFPSAIEDIILASGEVAEYQVTVNNARSLTALSVQIEPSLICPDPAALASRLEKSFEDAFALRVPVKSVPTGTLPRFEMKAKRWVKI